MFYVLSGASYPVTACRPLGRGVDQSGRTPARNRVAPEISRQGQTMQGGSESERSTTPTVSKFATVIFYRGVLAREITVLAVHVLGGSVCSGDYGIIFYVTGCFGALWSRLRRRTRRTAPRED